MSDNVEPAHDTTRCRLPFPIGCPENERLLLEMRDLDEDYQFVEVVLFTPTDARYAETFFGRMAGGEVVNADGGTVSYPSLAAAIARMLLQHFGAQSLGLPEPFAARWDFLETAHRSRVWAQCPEISSKQMTDAQFTVRHNAEDAAELAVAAEALGLLNTARDQNDCVLPGALQELIYRAVRSSHPSRYQRRLALRIV